MDAQGPAGIGCQQVAAGETQVEQDGAGARFERLLQETRDLLQEIDAPLLDLIRVLEGQGSLLNPAYPGGFEILAAARPDLVVVGNALSRGNPAVEEVLNSGIPYTSGPRWLGENYLRNKTVIAVAGTHGKTTTTSLVAAVLADFQPGVQAFADMGSTAMQVSAAGVQAEYQTEVQPMKVAILQEQDSTRRLQLVEGLIALNEQTVRQLDVLASLSAAYLSLPGAHGELMSALQSGYRASLHELVGHIEAIGSAYQTLHAPGTD